MELEAGRLALAAPRVVVGVEDAVAEQIPDGVPEVLPLGKAGELGLKHELEVSRIGRDHAVQVREPGTLEDEGSVLKVEHLSDPLVHVLPETEDERREHADDGPDSQPLLLLLPYRVEGDEDGPREEELHAVDLR